MTLLAQRQCQRSTCAVSKGLNGLPTVRKPGLPTVRQRALDLLKIWIRVAFVLRTVGLPRSRQRALDSPDAASMSAEQRCRQQGSNGLPTVRKPGLPTVRQRALDLLKIWIRAAFVLRTVGLPRSRQRVLDSPDAASMSAKHRYRQQGPYGLPIVRKPGSCCQTPYGKRIDRLTDCP